MHTSTKLVTFLLVFLASNTFASQKVLTTHINLSYQYFNDNKKLVDDHPATIFYSVEKGECRLITLSLNKLRKKNRHEVVVNCTAESSLEQPLTSITIDAKELWQKLALKDRSRSRRKVDLTNDLMAEVPNGLVQIEPYQVNDYDMRLYQVRVTDDYSSPFSAELSDVGEKVKNLRAELHCISQGRPISSDVGSYIESARQKERAQEACIEEFIEKIKDEEIQAATAELEEAATLKRAVERAIFLEGREHEQLILKLQFR